MIGGNATYQVDLFGRIRRSIEAARADEEEVASIRDTVKVTVAADVARAYVGVCAAHEAEDLAVRSKSKKLSPDEFAGGTITVSNLGAFGIDSFSAIIIPPRLQSSAWAASAMCPSWARRVRSSPVNVCGSGSAAIIASSMAPSLPASLPRCAS
jgi:pyruvate/2-oxoglutarate dehydrogenase complex dihydrolipoamide acyltransferase (E2) component